MKLPRNANLMRSETSSMSISSCVGILGASTAVFGVNITSTSSKTCVWSIF